MNKLFIFLFLLTGCASSQVTKDCSFHEEIRVMSRRAYLIQYTTCGEDDIVQGSIIITPAPKTRIVDKK